MPDESVSLAIETSSRDGSVTLGHGGAVAESIDLPEQRRHAVELLPRIDAMFEKHHLTPADLAEVYVSVGPGSFTGLRVAVTTAKMLARVTGCRLVAVPTLDVVVENAPVDLPHVAVMLNAKGGRWFTGLFERSGERWRREGDAALLTCEQALARAARPLAIVADKPPPPEGWSAPDVRVLARELARPRSQVVWRIGRALAAQGRYVDAYELTPMYVRLPDAEEKWREQANSQ